MLHLQEVDYQSVMRLPKVRYLHNFKRFEYGCLVAS